MKRCKLVAVLLVVTLLAVLCAACSKTEQPQLTVKVNGKEIKADGTVYAVEVANDITKAVVEATATVGEVTGTGTFDLKEGANEFTLTLTADGTETKYTVKVNRKAAEKPADTTLAEVKAGDLTLTETAGKYAATVDYETDKIMIAATATDSAATVEGTGEKTLNVGKNEVTLTVKNGKENKTYTVEITREAAVLTLAEVKVGDTVLTAGADGVYTCSVANTVSSIDLAATATKPYVQVEGTGSKTLRIGENVFTVTVRLDDSTKQEYTVKVVREAADLTMAEVKAGDTVLTANGRTYVYDVGNDVTEIVLSATANNGAATVTGTGKVNLNVGANTFTITVSVDEETAEYTVTVNRAASSVKTIAGITADGVSAAYDEETGTYTVTVGKYTANVVITLTSDVASYELDDEIGTLLEGENEFIITVTAQDGTTATYKLLLNVVLPIYNVRYSGNINEALENDGYTYKYGEAQTINIVLGDKYNRSYRGLTVTYKVGDGATKTVTLDDTYGFTIPADEAIGDVIVTVEGIKVNVYTVTYHRNGSTTTEEVEHGAAAQDSAITPSSESKDVLDGYLYTHLENWMTTDGGMVVADLTSVTSDMDVYYKDQVLVRSEVAYYAPMGGAVTYYTIRQMNAYVAGDANGDVVFMVMIKSLATDGIEENGKTSFVIYGTAVWNEANELGVSVAEDELNRWFTVKASAADKKVTVYRPDGSVAGEKVFAEYAADTISLAIHADAAVAAVDPTIPEICTVTYLDEDGNELHKEKVIRGSAAKYTYEKASEDLGDGYTLLYVSRWLTAKGGTSVADLINVQENVSVYLGTSASIYKHYEQKSYPDYSTVLASNKYLLAGADVIRLRVRVLTTVAGYPCITVYPSRVWNDDLNANETARLYVGDILGQWCTVEIDKTAKKVTIYHPNGSVADTKTITDFSIDNITFFMNSHSFDVAVDVVKAEYYDTDKTTLLYSGYVSDPALFSYVGQADAEGYGKTVTGWAAMEGGNNKYYAQSATYTKTSEIAAGTYTTVGALNQYVAPDSDGIVTFKVKFTYSEWCSFKFSSASNWTPLEDACNVGLDVSNSGKWYTFVVDTVNDTVQVIDPAGTVVKTAENVTEDNIAVFAFLPSGGMTVEVTTC